MTRPPPLLFGPAIKNPSGTSAVAVRKPNGQEIGFLLRTRQGLVPSKPLRWTWGPDERLRRRWEDPPVLSRTLIHAKRQARAAERRCIQGETP